MIDLRKSGAIIIKEKKGRKKAKGRRKRSKSTGKTHKNIGKRKKNYVILTRKLRNYLKGIYSAGEISKEKLNNLRKKIKNKEFKSKAHIKEFLESLKKDGKVLIYSWGDDFFQLEGAKPEDNFKNEWEEVKKRKLNKCTVSNIDKIVKEYGRDSRRYKALKNRCSQRRAR